MDLETLSNKVMEHDNLLTKQYENIKTLYRTVEQQGKLLDTVHKMNEVQVEILTEMKYIRNDISRVEKNLGDVKVEIKEQLCESENEMDVRINGVKGEIKAVSQEVDIIKDKPAKRYEQIVTKLIDIIIGIVAGGLLAKFIESILK